MPYPPIQFHAMWTVDQSKILTRRELAAVLADLTRKGPRSLSAQTNLVIVRLACCCGLRVSEIAGLRTTHAVGGTTHTDKQLLNGRLVRDDLFVTAGRRGSDARQFQAVERALARTSLAAVAGQLAIHAARIGLANQHRQQRIVSQIVIAFMQLSKPAAERLHQAVSIEGIPRVRDSWAIESAPIFPWPVLTRRATLVVGKPPPNLSVPSYDT